MWTMRGLAVAAAVAALLRADEVAARPFKYRGYGEMVAYLEELNATFPEVLRVYVAQDKYALPYPPELTCIEDEATGRTVPCKHYVVHMTNHSTLAAHPDRPQVFFSGALHGDERIGPITTMEMIALVAKLATAYAHPDSPEAAALEDVSVHTQRWVHHLVNTRDVVITPMTNAYGYSRDQRTELLVDPNRDYNYMRSGASCMQTMTSRVVNEIWRDHIFQLAITFHGGMRAISYEWGSPNHYSPSNSHRSQKSPDDAAQAQLSSTLALFAGKFADEKLYPTGTMNDIVYGVTGGMEDWGYAASWENNFVAEDEHKPFKPCEPTTFGGYDSAKTVYNNITHRVFNILVETSNDKHPAEGALGEFEDIYNAELDFYSVKKGVPSLGHVSQNVRLALMLMDMVQPYLRWVDAPVQLPAFDAAMEAKQDHARDRFPLANLFVEDSKQLTSMGCGGFAVESTQIASCNSTKCIIQLESGKPLKLQIGWEVLGAITVDKTNVQLASEPTFSAGGIISESAVQKGTTRRFFGLAEPATTSNPPENTDTLGTSLFVSCVDLHTKVSKKFYLRAMATVDQGWRKQAANGEDLPSPHIPPQSHYVNARTNPKWSKTWNGHQVKGSLYWYSPTIEITVESSIADTDADTESTTGSGGDFVTELMSSVDGSSDSSLAQEEPVTTAPALTPAIPATPTTETPSMTPGTPGPDDDGDETDEMDDGEVATEPEVTPSWAPKPATAETPATAADNILSPSAEDDFSLVGVQKTDAAGKKTSSLLGFGYLTLGLGGVVITMTLAYMYKRVFRSQRRAYMNINQQRSPRSRFGHPAPCAGDDDDDP